MPLDTDRRKWWIGHLGSGCFAIPQLADEETGTYVPYLVDITKFDPQPEPGKWRLEDAGDGSFHIKDDQTFKYMNMFTNINRLAAILTDGNSGQSALWRFEVDDVYDAPALRNLRQADKHPGYGEPPAQTSLHPPWDRTDPVVIGEAAVPAPCVDDDGHDLEWKLKYSPFYVLRRSSVWKSQFRVYDGFREEHHEVYWDEGMTETVSQTVEWHLNLSINYTGGFSLKGLSAQISPTLEAGLSVSTTTTWEESYFKHEEYDTTYPSNNGVEYAIADWERVDVYKLFRVPDGCDQLDDEVMSWEFTVPNSQISRSFQAPSPTG